MNLDKNDKLLLVGFVTGMFSILSGMVTESIVLLGAGAGVMLLCVLGLSSKKQKDKEVKSLV